MRRAEGGTKILGYFVWKITILCQKIIFSSNFRGGGGRARCAPPWIRPCQGSMLKGLVNKLLNSYIWHSGCPNYQFTAFVFFIFWLVGEGEVWFEGDSTWLINYKKRIRYYQFFPQAQLNLHLGIYINLWTVFSLCCLKYESFSNCQQ